MDVAGPLAEDSLKLLLHLVAGRIEVRHVIDVHQVENTLFATAQQIVGIRDEHDASRPQIHIS